LLAFSASYFSNQLFAFSSALGLVYLTAFGCLLGFACGVVSVVSGIGSGVAM
jgi:hypothetical protein